MNEQEMMYWIKKIWTKCAPRFSNPRSLLVLDSFSAHIMDSVKRRFIEKSTNIAIIPGRLTSRLQPLDVSVNKSFKTKVIDLLCIYFKKFIKFIEFIVIILKEFTKFIIFIL